VYVTILITGNRSGQSIFSRPKPIDIRRIDDSVSVIGDF